MKLETRTGRQRYRQQNTLLHGPLVVLQHEWHVKGHEITDDPFSAAMHQIERTEWRDARIEDVTEATQPTGRKD